MWYGGGETKPVETLMNTLTRVKNIFRGLLVRLFCIMDYVINLLYRHWKYLI